MPGDPISLEIHWARLIGIVDEAGTALRRAAFSTIVRECNDFAVCLMDAGGGSVAEGSAGTPAFVGILPRTLKAVQQSDQWTGWHAGDRLITNDPWMTAGHLHDIAMVAPMFHRDRLVGFFGSIAHVPDIGGALFSADCRDVFEEGLRIPPAYLVRAGDLNPDVVAFIKANVRVPDQVIGDLEAQIAAGAVCQRRLAEFLVDTGLDDLQALSAGLQQRAERTMRRSVAAIPDGCWRSTVQADGFGGDPLRIECAVTVDGDDLAVDYSGTSPQVGRGLNSVLNFTFASTAYPLKCALDPGTPRNEGSYRPFTITAPPGCLLNPAWPAACNARQLSGHLLAGAVYKCLSQVVPDLVVAESGTAPTLRSVWSGVDSDGRRFTQILFGSGGMGASAVGDGHSCLGFPTNTGFGSVEAFEAAAPLVIWRKELVPDSGGAGRFRGGLGQEVEVALATPGDVQLSLMVDRQDNPPEGLLGGGSGTGTAAYVVGGDALDPKGRTVLPSGTHVVLRHAGAGGYGLARDRDGAAIRHDLAEGYVTADAALRDYGFEA